MNTGIHEESRRNSISRFRLINRLSAANSTPSGSILNTDKLRGNLPGRYLRKIRQIKPRRRNTEHNRTTVVSFLAPSVGRVLLGQFQTVVMPLRATVEASNLPEADWNA